MAMIQCPHCGESVSDSALKCIHCGGILKEAPPPPKEYKELSYTEKEALSLEFEQNYPEYAFLKLQKRNKTLEIARIVCIVLFFVFWLLGDLFTVLGFVFSEAYETIGLVIYFVSFWSLVLYIVFIIVCRKERKNYLLKYKIFVKWLLTSKQIICRRIQWHLSNVPSAGKKSPIKHQLVRTAVRRFLYVPSAGRFRSVVQRCAPNAGT